MTIMYIPTFLEGEWLSNTYIELLMLLGITIEISFVIALPSTEMKQYSSVLNEAYGGVRVRVGGVNPSSL